MVTAPEVLNICKHAAKRTSESLSPHKCDYITKDQKTKVSAGSKARRDTDSHELKVSCLHRNIRVTKHGAVSTRSSQWAISASTMARDR